MDDSLSDSNSSNPSEETIQYWVLEVKNGKDELFAKLIETFSFKLQTMIYRMILDWDETRDVAQETFIHAYRALPRYQPRSKFQTWLFTIGTRKALDLLRKRKRYPKEVELNTNIETDGREKNHQDPVIQKETILEIERAVQELPPDQRAIFILAEYENYSLKEIAEVIGGSVKRVEMHLYRAHIALRERLKLYLR